MKSLLLLLTLGPSLLGTGTTTSAATKSYMSDKTEVSVDLEVSGAEALCQTEDGYVWIAQYSGLTRYDSKEFVTYKNYTENGTEYSILNVRALASKGNSLYIATSENIFYYSDNEFTHLNVTTGSIQDIVLDNDNDILYISSYGTGGTIYDLKTGVSSTIPNTEKVNVNDIALDKARNTYYYQLDSGVYAEGGKEIYLYPKVFDIYTHGDILYIGQDDGVIRCYNMASGTFLDDIVLSDQVNRILYSEQEKTLFVASEKKGLYCINLAGDTPNISVAGDLENKNQLVDLMIDYENNLWIASHVSGVSIITKNALTDLLYDDAIWKGLDEGLKIIYSLERYGNIVYIASVQRVYLYDLTTGKILLDNAIMQTIDAYVEAKSIKSYSPRDVEIFNGKIYFAINGIGLVEYNPETDAVNIYDVDYISSYIKTTVGNVDLALTNTARSLKAFDDYLAIGYGRGLMKFDGTNYSAMYTDSNVLFFQKSQDNKMLFCTTKGIYEVDDEFTTATLIPTADVSGNILKFLVDGNYIYYTLNSRLFRAEKVEGEYVSKEIIMPYVKGSIVELAKIEYNDKNDAKNYKYVIASETQVYITDSLDVNQLTDFEFYDATNGLKSIKANSSGYYDREEQKYYFQTSNGIFVYDFNETKAASTPVKVALSSVVLDDVPNYGNLINIKSDTYRVTVNLSVLGFRPNKGYTIYYKMDGVDEEYHTITGDDRNINYTNVPGGDYTFHAYAIDEYGQRSNEITVSLIKDKKVHEQVWFWVVVAVLALSLVVGVAFLYTHLKTRRALRKQLEYKNITLESIQAIARTIDAKDEYTNGHSTRVGYYSKLIAENLGMSQDDVDNIYYIALLHDIGKIAIPDKILNKPGRLTDEEFAVMKSHTTRGAKILKGISTIPHIVEGAKSHHEKYDGTGYPEGLKGEDIPYVARIICCADCFDAMASKRVYKESFSLDTIISEFERCSGTQFDPAMAKVVVEMIKNGKLKPYTVESTYLGEDGKTHRISEDKEGE